MNRRIAGLLAILSLGFLMAATPAKPGVRQMFFGGRIH